MFLDTSINSQMTVLTNVYQNFVEAAMKLYRYMRALPSVKRPKTSLIVGKSSVLVSALEMRGSLASNLLSTLLTIGRVHSNNSGYDGACVRADEEQTKKSDGAHISMRRQQVTCTRVRSTHRLQHGSYH